MLRPTASDAHRPKAQRTHLCNSPIMMYRSRRCADARPRNGLVVALTRDHEPRRGEESALPIRRGRAVSRPEPLARRRRHSPAALSGFFAAPGHERPPSAAHEIVPDFPFAFHGCDGTPTVGLRCDGALAVGSGWQGLRYSVGTRVLRVRGHRAGVTLPVLRL